MTRVARAQPDLFAPVQTDMFAASSVGVATEPSDAVAELRALVASLRVADRLPWADAYAAMQEEQRVLGLGRSAGSEGQALVEAVFTETERLLAATDRMVAA